MAQREASGESLWTTRFDKEFRIKLIYAMRDSTDNSQIHFDRACGELKREFGRAFLASPANDSPKDLEEFVLSCPDEELVTVIEIFYHICLNQQIASLAAAYAAGLIFKEKVKALLRVDRIAYELIDGMMIPVESFELHASIIEPTVRLLRNLTGWEKVQDAYLEALDEIKNNKPDNAITDASRALEEALNFLGCEGNSLGKRINDGIKKGVFSSHDKPMLDEIDKVMHWVSADRSEKGDAHLSPIANLDDAWFHVHIVGAVLVRLNMRSGRN